MKCYDKELIINGKSVNSPEQQVWENAKAIELLKQYIKPIYQTTEELTESSTGVLIEDTNAPAGTKVGWILTEDGLFFQIEDSNETAFMLKFLANFKGENGEDGIDGITPTILANATINSQTGTPQVTVSVTGSEYEKTFNFSFSNLKGEKGDPGVSTIKVEVVQTLPASGDSGTLYFVPNSGTSPNIYDEYVWVNSTWELVGQQQIDLSNYIQKSNISGLVKNDGSIDTNAYATMNDIKNEPVLLWQNATPNASYSNNSINLLYNINNYKYIVICYKYYSTANWGYQFIKVQFNQPQIILIGGSGYSNEISATRIIRREPNIFNALTIGEAYLSTSSDLMKTDNNYMIPVAIYGTNIL